MRLLFRHLICNANHLTSEMRETESLLHSVNIHDDTMDDLDIEEVNNFFDC